MEKGEKKMIKYIDTNKIKIPEGFFDDLNVPKLFQWFGSLPTADVAPVVHGRWIDKGEYAVCMECGGRSSTQYNGVEPIPLMTQFCPHCGAKMDGKE